MATTRNAKQYDISEKSDKYNVTTKYGTLNKKEPCVLYTRSKGRVHNNLSNQDISKRIYKTKNEFMQSVTNIVNDTNMYHKELLCDLDISEKCFLTNKDSYLKYDIFVKPIAIRPMEEQENNIKSLMKSINNTLFDILYKNDFSML